MKYIATIKIGEEEKKLYVDLNEEGTTIHYYLDNDMIGAHSFSVASDKIIFKASKINEIMSHIKEKSKADEFLSQIKDTIENIDLDEVKKREEELRDPKRIEDLQHVLGEGFENREIRRIGRVDAKQKITVPKEEEENTRKKDDLTPKGMQQDKKLTRGDIKSAIRQEVKTGSSISKTQTVGQALNLKPEVTQLYVVEVSAIDTKDLLEGKDEVNKRGSAGYALCTINQDGQPEILDLPIDSSVGSNPTKQNYQVEEDGDVKKDDVLCRFKIDGQKTVTLTNGTCGEIEMSYSVREARDGKDRIGIPIETRNIKYIQSDVRDLATTQERGGNYTIDNGIDEAKTHKGHEMESEDIDGKETTHSKNCDVAVKVYVKRLKEEAESILNVFNQADLEKRVKDYMKKIGKEELTKENFKQLKKEVETEAEATRVRGAS